MEESAVDCESVSKCDIFDFMAKHVGMTVVHPGGFNATNELLKELHIDENSHVIDIACGKGTSAVYTAKKYGCKAAAIDISPELIKEAKRIARMHNVSKRVDFFVGDAMKLPFESESFDAALSQAMLVLVDDKIRAIQEARRVLKRGGNAGWLELSWKNKPPEDFLEHVSTALCSYCMKRAETYDGWKKTFEKAGVQNVRIIERTFKNEGVFRMVRDEGIMNTLRIFSRYAGNRDVRKRMRLINATITKFTEYFGYGIYSFEKT